ncbi:MAG TPA: peptidyl-alpha-hydroxyglycine alpha-amidating lyase family protein [Candidatus Sulfotelmatobacter sp.]|nr:peptidyl-alpha-hydroxyglycine alpha-amidating lyase family protein [Candidatus Sulfotelmatobacter sp.]
MKRYVLVLIMLLGVAAYAQRGGGGAQPGGATPQDPGGRGAGGGRGGGGFGGGRGNPEQDALEAKTPQIPFDAVSLPLMPAGHTIGETEGVAINSKKHLFVYTRSGNAGPARGAQAAELFEFDEKGNYVKEWGQNAYGFSFAHAIRFDKDDNLWVVDEGSNMVMKFNPQGLVTMVLGRKDEAIDYLERFLEEANHTEAGANSKPGAGAGRGGSFGRPTDVTWDTQGNIFVSDGYDNSRVAKFTKDGDFVKSVGSRGNGPLQFSTPHTITSDAKGLIYVGDRGNNRIQVVDSDLNLVKTFTNVRAPWAVCVTPPNAQGQQYLYSADAGGKIYKLDLNGNLLGWFGTTGKKVGQFFWVHEMHCVSENELYTGEAQNWRVQHITLHPERMQKTSGN